MKKLETVVSVCFVAALSLTGLSILCKKPQAYSANENRYLQKRPAWEWSAVANGSWQTDITAYMTDQIPCRDTWTALQAKLQQWYGKKDIGGVWLGDDHCYFEKITPNDISLTRYQSNLRAVAALAQNGTPVTLLTVPPASIIEADRLPKWATVFDASALYALADAQLGDSCTRIDLRPALSSAYNSDPSRTLFYRTDHHWTTYGAYLGYAAFSAAQGGSAPSYESLPMETVTESFYGTLYSKVLDTAARTDAIDILFAPPAARVTCNGTTAALYDMAALTRKDQYQVFFGGNYGRVDIETDNPNGKHLLIFKDSYANAMVPFLLADYAKITMIDMRYQTGDWKEVYDSQPDAILVLYELGNFAKDSKLATVATVLASNA